MARYRKTYGARGLLEWHMMLRSGKTRVRLTFKGGSMGANGVVPAKYVTESEPVQRLIERSEEFVAGRVYLHGDPVRIDNERNTDAANDYGRGNQDCCPPVGGESLQYV